MSGRLSHIRLDKMKERILMEAYEVEKKCVFENFRLDRVARFDK